MKPSRVTESFVWESQRLTGQTPTGIMSQPYWEDKVGEASQRLLKIPSTDVNV